MAQLECDLEVEDSSRSKTISMEIGKLLWNRLPTTANVGGFMQFNVPTCPICKRGQHSSQHIFFECDSAMEVWTWRQRKLNIGGVDKRNWRQGSWLTAPFGHDKNTDSCIKSIIALMLWFPWINWKDVHFRNHRVYVWNIYSSRM